MFILFWFGQTHVLIRYGHETWNISRLVDSYSKLIQIILYALSLNIFDNSMHSSLMISAVIWCYQGVNPEFVNSNKNSICASIALAVSTMSLRISNETLTYIGPKHWQRYFPQRCPKTIPRKGDLFHNEYNKPLR